MPRAIPILVIVGLAIYSFFDVLQNRPEDIRKFSRTTWMVLVLIPILGAALWFIMGRPRYGRGGYAPPRIITLRGSPPRAPAPDDDPAFLRRLEEEAWLRKRDEARRAAQEPTDQDPPMPEDDGEPGPPREGPSTGPGIAPA
jgi:hypothetical protein